MDRNWLFGLAADAVMLIHFAFVAFVVLSVPAIWIGKLLRKPFATAPRFRLLHLLAMAVVLVQALFGVLCPLTTLEMKLRRMGGGEEGYATSFIQHWVHKLLFVQASETLLTWIYGGFFVLIVATMIFVPPRFRLAAR